MFKTLEGKKLSDEIKAKVKKDVAELKGNGVDVGLALILSGNDLASKQYFNSILKAAEKVGINVYEHILSPDVSINEILNLVNSINKDERMNGLLVFFPLPHRVNARRVVNAIIPAKDIDGLGAVSVGRLAAEESTFQLFHDDLHATLTDERRILSVSNFLPCTPFGVIRLLKYSGVTIKGKNAVVIGKSLATGKPLSLMLLAKEATVTTCHRSTHDLAFHLKNADIICSATGVRNLIKGDMISDGAVVVDIGVSVLGDGKIVGDVDFESVSKKASMITPVPGGVGPVTIAMLLENTVRSAQRSELLTV